MLNSEACLEVVDLKRVPRRREFDVYLSNGGSIRALKEDIEHRGIDVGSSLCLKAIRELEERCFKKRAEEIVERLLRIRPRTKGEIRRRLLKYQLPSQICDKVLGELEGRGLLNDMTFARLWIEEKMVKQGRRRIRSELLAKGIDASVVEQALELYYDESNELEIAKGIVTKRLRRLRELPLEVARRRLFGLLLRRGFESGIAAEAIGSILGRQTREGDYES